MMDKMPKDKFLELVMNNLEGLVVADAEGKYVFVSEKWTQLTGLTNQEVHGKYVHDITKESKVDECLKTRKPQFGQLVRVPSRDGGLIPMISYYAPIFDGEELVGCVTVCSVQGMNEILDTSGNIESMMQELHYFQDELAKIQGARYSLKNIIGTSPGISHVKSTIRRCARTTSTVIIQGETGTGKELVAHSIHALSSRASQPFIKINCAAIPSELLESELFGYVGGAFTGASRSGKKGKFQMADGGTLFLDEINQMPLQLQPKLLRALQEREVEPVGSGVPEPVDVRVIAASNMDLLKMVKEKTFREDLYYRLNVIPVNIPPLRERKEDIPAIAEATLESLNHQLGMMVPGITEDAKLRLQGYDWPGNVRELRNVIERGMNEAWMEMLSWKHLKGYFQNKAYHKPSGMTEAASDTDVMTIQEAKELAERKAIAAALSAADGNRSQAAQLLGITRTMLYRKMNKLDIKE